MSSLKKYVGIVVDRRPHVEPRAHFIDNAFFRSPALNRMYSVRSITDGLSQTLYRHAHLRHHLGNMNRIGANDSRIACRRGTRPFPLAAPPNRSSHSSQWL